MSKTPKSKQAKSLRQTIDDSASKTPKKRRLKTSANNVSKPLKNAYSKGKKEFNIPLPDNKVGRFLAKRPRLIPSYFRESWKELKEVTWPDRKTTIKLTIAVFIFAIVFGLAIAIIDYGLDKLFRILILEK